MAQIAPTSYFTCGVMLDSAEEGWLGLALVPTAASGLRILHLSFTSASFDKLR